MHIKNTAVIRHMQCHQTLRLTLANSSVPLKIGNVINPIISDRNNQWHLFSQ